MELARARDATSDQMAEKKKIVAPLSFRELEPGIADRALPDFDDDLPPHIPDKPSSIQDLEPVFDIPVRISAILGKSSMKVVDLMKLGRGAVIELDRKVGEAIDIYANNRMIARGEVVVVDDRLGVTMTEIIKSGKK